MRFATCWFATALAALPALFGCAKYTSLQVLRPARVTAPSHIQTVAYIDRSRAPNAGQGILGAIEGALSGEALGADTEGRHAAGAALVEGLRNSPRFAVTRPMLSTRAVGSNLFDRALSWRTASRICRMANCEGIVSLEAFDSDSITQVERENYTESEQGTQVTKVRFNATRTTDVLTAWRFYDVVNRQRIDDVREHRTAQVWTAAGGSEAAAIDNLPSQLDTVATVGAQAGEDYAFRIAPQYTWVQRFYYAHGDDRLVTASTHVRALDWQGATAIWAAIDASETDPKIRGKARFNLALAAEVQGDLVTAIRLVKQASVDLGGNGRSRSYVSSLVNRQAENRVLQQQMGSPNGG